MGSKHVIGHQHANNAAAPVQVPAVAPLPPPEPDMPRIDELTLARMNRLTERERACRAELELTGARLNMLVHEFLNTDERAKPLNERVVALQAEQRTARDAYSALVAQVARETKLDMSLHTYDDETGIISLEPNPQAKE
jgi:hypothetical protein